MANLAIIRSICKEQRITLQQLAREVGITEGALHIALRTGRTSIDTLERIAATLHVHPGVFFNESYRPSDEINDLRNRLNQIQTLLNQAVKLTEQTTNEH